MKEEDAEQPTLEELRQRIDSVDDQLIGLLNERARVVVEVGRLKQAQGLPIYAPDRERAVLEKVIGKSQGPLGARAIEGVYRELMSGSFALERPLRIGYLGPAGSFSHAAATSHFGSSVELGGLRAIGDVFTEVRRGRADYGLVPIENSTMGGVLETLDAFRDSGDEVTIYAEVQVAIRHALLANCAPDAVVRIHSKPEVFPQCRRWLATQYPDAERIPAASTSRAVQTVRAAYDADPGCGDAAIASSFAGSLYGLKVLFDEVEDDANNITRFFVIAREAAQPTGDDKTSIMFSTRDTPGALVKVLTAFESAGVNLSHIDKRPSGRVNWDYTFFVDALGHRDDDAMKRAVELAADHAKELSILGSYPRATRIL